MKKIIIVCMIAVIACLGFTACGSEEAEEQTYATYAKYMELADSLEYVGMDKEALDEYFGIEGELDEEATARNVETFGEGFSTYHYYGETKDAYALVLFKTDQNGNQRVSSISPSRGLIDDGTYVEEETEE